VGCGTWKRRFFALTVRITGKLFKIDGYMLRGVWQALNCLFIHATFCVIAAGASPVVFYIRRNLQIVQKFAGRVTRNL